MAPGIAHGRSPQRARHLLGAPTWQQWEGWRKPEQEALLRLRSPSLAARTAPRPQILGWGGSRVKVQVEGVEDSASGFMANVTVCVCTLIRLNISRTSSRALGPPVCWDLPAFA